MQEAQGFTRSASASKLSYAFKEKEKAGAVSRSNTEAVPLPPPLPPPPPPPAALKGGPSQPIKPPVKPVKKAEHASNPDRTGQFTVALSRNRQAGWLNFISAKCTA